MNLLLICRVQPNLPIPPLGEALRAHIEEKKHPDARASSLTTWNLLVHGLKSLDVQTLPEVEFAGGGKPRFINCGLHFSLSHSGDWAAALLSPEPCAVDLEQMRPETQARLESRSLSDAERRTLCPFFEAWTKKECIVKLDGRGFTAHPDQIDTLHPHFDGCFFTRTLQPNTDAYMLTALCMNARMPIFKQIVPEAL